MFNSYLLHFNDIDIVLEKTKRQEQAPALHLKLTSYVNYNLSLTFPNVSFSSDSEESRLEMLYVLPF